MSESAVRSITLDNADIEGLTNLLKQWDDLPYVLTAGEIHDRILDILALKNHAIFVYEENGILKGYIYAGEVILLGMDSHIEIHSVLVDKMHRRQGIAETLIRHCENWASGTGMSRIMLSSRIHLENAHRLYRKLGYSLFKQSYFFHKKLTSN